eukprot:6392237-Alexandrium_andersonii.AAC.1
MPEDDAHDTPLVGKIAQRALRALRTVHVAVSADTGPLKVKPVEPHRLVAIDGEVIHQQWQLLAHQAPRP